MGLGSKTQEEDVAEGRRHAARKRNNLANLTPAKRGLEGIRTKTKGQGQG